MNQEIDNQLLIDVISGNKKSHKIFVDLCNRSIKDNEDILDYTKLFEKNRSEVESDINKATNRDDANQLKSKFYYCVSQL